ncbi:MAG: YeeE/YedE family protein [Flavobacteriales bacterium]|nr:YeeE/YedE family protein [Flavobacteriales bacterium]
MIKRFKIKSVSGEIIDPQPKPFNKVGNITGGIIFGFGWALVGACPEPIYALIGSGNSIMILALISALAGVFCYAVLKKKLPH